MLVHLTGRNRTKKSVEVVREKKSCKRKDGPKRYFEMAIKTELESCGCGDLRSSNEVGRKLSRMVGMKNSGKGDCRTDKRNRLDLSFLPARKEVKKTSPRELARVPAAMVGLDPFETIFETQNNVKSKRKKEGCKNMKTRSSPRCGPSRVRGCSSIHADK